MHLPNTSGSTYSAPEDNTSCMVVYPPQTKHSHAAPPHTLTGCLVAAAGIWGFTATSVAWATWVHCSW
jgi:hypothetical protein